MSRLCDLQQWLCRGLLCGLQSKIVESLLFQPRAISVVLRVRSLHEMASHEYPVDCSREMGHLALLQVLFGSIAENTSTHDIHTDELSP